MNRAQFDQQFQEFKRQSRDDGRFDPQADQQNPILNEDTPTTGYEPHYTLHVAWAARKIAAFRPSQHVDFGSSLFFMGIVSAFVPFTFCDIRRVQWPAGWVQHYEEDLTHLSFGDGSLQSVSCLHTIEHIGLGRYGDQLDASGDRKAASELSRVLARGGQLLIATPIEDPPRVTWNSDRLYSAQMVLDLFPSLNLEEFSLITCEPNFFENCGIEKTRGVKYGCGCFSFRKGV